MDNLTHSMTAAIAAKFVDRGSEEDKTSRARTLFWLMVASVNFPDLDVVMALFRDPILTIKTHRWITHSVLAAPLFAVVPAAVFYRFSRVKNFRLLWLVAMAGIYLHIVSDLVTPYGTMLLAPFSNHRFTLSSQFIVDLYFSFGLLAFILLGRYHSARRKFWHKAGLIFMVTYLVGTFGLQQYAYSRVSREVKNKRIDAQKISTLPLPLSVFDWAGLVQTKEGIQRAYFTLWDDRIVFEDMKHAEDKYVAAARQKTEVQWYLQFAHHPLIGSYQDGKNHVVEISDLQFSAPARIVKMMGLKRPRNPFTMKITYDATGKMLNRSFNE